MQTEKQEDVVTVIGGNISEYELNEEKVSEQNITVTSEVKSDFNL